MEVSGQNHTPASLSLVEEPRDPLKTGQCGSQNRSGCVGEEKVCCPCRGDSNRGPSVTWYICGVTHYFLGAINRECHD